MKYNLKLMKADKYDDLRLILSRLIAENKKAQTLGESSDILEKYLQHIIILFDTI